MRRITGIAAALAGTAVLVSGCGHSDSGSDSAREVTVVGNGQVRGAPDILNADLGVAVTAGDVSTAVDTANSRAKAVTDAVIGAGAKREDVQTADVSVQPQYGPDQKVTGYNATNSLHIVVRELPKASAILAAAVQAGGNETRVQGVSFALDDNSKLLADARARAFADAKARAEQYAVLAGLKLREVKTVSESASGGAPPPPGPRYNQAPMSDVPLEPGMQTVTFNVTVTWTLG
ncbi:SIMPL domain-containing protein [Nocardia sp. CDC159]|uniref:SIMPL domain-containing protein n=1 Tax=Nocardia pulmonis TaxID=2951408 RepID=A0A9X2J058_9NOCA|nr:MULTISPECIES: SIMPL domain-containing protein [Nocardia]MCM6777414.1 SIMPL domain-containing protein [Nocardia pulmonis]MCM6790299.1 SIMPL domain-containing protein [Nocardia sp. CDC159]